ncbi:hypothetical protein HYV70_04680 [Candidatus Uhrbacteria bacterium]|nr:hypothetical protein [Candidatus Uhrbacteria bacterium]
MTSISHSHSHLPHLMIRAVEVPPPGVRRIVPKALVYMFLRETSRFTIESSWTPESALVELTSQINQGRLAIVWQLGNPSIPVGFAICEQNESGLVLSHFYIERRIPREQESLVTQELFDKVVKAQMRRLGLQTVSVTAPLFSAQPIQLCLKGASVSRVGVY